MLKSADNLQVRWQRIGACVLVVARAAVELVCTAIPALDYLKKSPKAEDTNREAVSC